jgi:cysteine-rich repeat protein
MTSLFMKVVRRLLPLLCAVLVGCGGPSVIVVSVTAESLPPISQIRITMSNARTNSVRVYPQVDAPATIQFPTSLAIVVPHSRSGALDLALEGLDASGQVVAHGIASTAIRVGDRTNVSVTLKAGPSPCGNGRPDAYEECDDHNLASGDGCDFLCRREILPPDAAVDDSAATTDAYPTTPSLDAAAGQGGAGGGTPATDGTSGGGRGTGGASGTGGTPGAGSGKTVLLVMGYNTPKDAALRPGDTKLKARLEARGFVVRQGDDDDPDASKATGAALVILSDTVGNQIGTKYTMLAIPIICAEHNLMDDLGMTGNAGIDHNAANVSQLVFTDPPHPLAAGMMGSVMVAGGAQAATWGNPAPAALRIAAIPNQPNQIAVFGYPTGAMMSGMAAPARRVGFFAGDAMADNMNDNGWKLFDAAVDWAVE